MSTDSRFFQHSTAIVETDAIGAGTRVWAFAHILPGARVGTGCNICDHTFLENDVIVGDRVTIKCGVQLWDGITLEDDVFVGPNATFTNDPFPRSGRHQETVPRTLVCRGASIGANATVVCGHIVGEYAFVGAGAVVTKDVPAYGLVLGVPGNVAGWICRCGVRLPGGETPVCTSCGLRYRRGLDADGAAILTPEASR